MNTLYDLTKKIDSLTYNSQQVLNALIRSCIASGSSSGYRVKKYGQTIELTREDIYCLYTFYEEWKAAGFPEDSSSFYDLLGRADRMFSSTESPSTAAVVKHSKILYMTDLNAGDDDDKWLERIRESAAPAATVSTAPIPLNLRTPLYDENMSTKSFSQYETYLFPLGYQRNELMGTPGNGEDYVAGGRNWTIDASDTLMLSGRHIVAGSCRNPQNRKDNYGDSVPTLGWGTESYSFGDSSFVFGFHSLAVGDYSGATGDKSVTYGGGSLALGGRGVRSVGAMSLSTNRYTTATGDDSAAMNTNTVTGGYPYEFTFDTVVSEEEIVSTDCDYYFDSNSNQCVSTSAVQAAQQAASKNVLYIDQNQVNNSGLNGLDIKVGDSVYVYDLAYMKDGVTVSPVDDDGYANRRILANVTERTGNAANGYRIVLDRQIKAEDGKYGSLVGGKIAACVRDVKVYDASGAEVDTDRVELGYGSTSLNSYTIARGGKQTVAGKWNVPNDEASLVVGIGNEGTGGIPQRLNGLVVTDKYSYLRMPGSRATIGVSTGTFNTRDDWNGNFKMYEGAFIQTGDTTGNTTLLRMSSDGISLTYRKSAAEQGKLLLDSGAVTLQAKGNLRLTFGESLILSGDTFGALTATDKAKSFTLTNSGTASSAIIERLGYAQATGSSGFYYCKPDSDAPANETKISGNTAEWPSHTGTHVFNSTVDTDNGYETAVLAIPASLENANGTVNYRPVVSIAHYNTAGTMGNTAQTKELAYIDDFDAYDERIYKSRMSFGMFAHAGFGYDDTAEEEKEKGYGWTSQEGGHTITRTMPAMYCAEESYEYSHIDYPYITWGHTNPLWAFMETNSTLGTKRAFSDTIEIHTSRTKVSKSKMFEIGCAKYTLNGNNLSISFDLSFYADNALGQTQVSGVALPVILGCGVERNSNATLNDVLFSQAIPTGQTSSSMYFGRMYGTVKRLDIHDRPSQVPEEVDPATFRFRMRGGYTASSSVFGGVTGMALEDGTVMLYIESPELPFRSIDTEGVKYRVYLEGIVPFVASTRCLGTNCLEVNAQNNNPWENNLKSQITNGSHFSMQDWLGAAGQLEATGLLNQLIHV